MAKTVNNVLKIVVSKIEIGESASEVEPVSYTDLGLQSEATMKVKLTPIVEREAGGSEVQKGYDCEVETDSLEVLNVSALEAFKNDFVWIKVTPIGTVSASNPIVRVKNFLCNVGLDLDLSAKGSSLVKITGKKYCSSVSEFYATATS